MKKILSVIIAATLALSVLAGCGGGTSGGGSGTTSGGASEPILLKVNNFAPGVLPFGIGIDHAAEYIERESNGAIEVQVYHDGTLLAFNDTYQGVRQNVADIAIAGPVATDSLVTLNGILTTMMQKYLTVDMQAMTDACYELIDAVPELQEEMESYGVRWLGFYTMLGANIHCKGIKPLTPDDLKGVGTEAPGSVSGYFALMGANAVTNDPGDSYLAMERGIVKAHAGTWTALDGYKIVEQTDYHLLFGADGGGIIFGAMGYIINADTWHSLSPEHQKIVWDAFRAASTLTIELDKPAGESAVSYSEEHGHEFVYLTTEAELAPWFDYIDQFNARWVERVSAAGFPAQSTLDKFEELLAKG